MSHHLSWRAVGLSLLCISLFLAFTSCVDQKTVFENQPFFDDPAPAAGGFLGYVQAEAGAPVCGNCHAQPVSQWRQTAHATAWEDLQASGGARDVCENCHTVSQLGNAETADAGWAATGDPRYLDVQCESCHGPGQTHVAAPEASQPIPSLAVGVELQNGCGECHRGEHHPFVEEWSQSKHAEVVTFAADRAECAGCHRGQDILLAWGVRARYQEQDAEEHLPIVCGVCHDPHDATFTGQLRFPVETPAIEVHLCARCHNRRSNPDPNSSHGLEPHAPEAPLLVGEGGWFPPNADIDQGDIIGTHGSEGNPHLCATCHVNMYTVTDAATGDFVFNATGHLFTAIPCVDEQGIPITGDCEYTAEARSFAACASSGCHTSEAAAAFILNEVATNRVTPLVEDLLALLVLVDPNLDEPGGEIDGAVSTFTIAEGAFFNYNLALHGGGRVFASTTHNPFLLEALLSASIQAVIDEYGVALPALTGGPDARGAVLDGDR